MPLIFLVGIGLRSKKSEVSGEIWIVTLESRMKGPERGTSTSVHGGYQSICSKHCSPLVPIDQYRVVLEKEVLYLKQLASDIEV